MSSIIKFQSAAIASTVALIVAGCGGSVVTPDLGPEGFYQTLSGTESGTSTIGGVGIRSNDGSNEKEVVSGSGSLNHATGSYSYGDADYSLSDPDGLDGNGQYSDGQGTIDTDGNAFVDTFAGVYEYVMPMTFNYEVLGVKYITNGFGGIISNASHVPIGGTANYTGEAVGLAVAGDAGLFELVGVSSIAVDFGAGDVDVTLNGFTATDADGKTTTAPFDTVVITGMTIAGNTFTGGDLVTLLSSTPITVIGSTTSYNSEGAFFGWDDADVIPDEVAGVSVTIGSDGFLLFSFVGD